MNEYLTINQLAIQWKLHPITIRRYIREGKLKAVKIGGRIRIATNTAQDMAKTINLYAHRSQPRHIAIRKPRQTFSETDPFWRLKGIGAVDQL